MRWYRLELEEPLFDHACAVRVRIEGNVYVVFYEPPNIIVLVTRRIILGAGDLLVLE